MQMKMRKNFIILFSAIIAAMLVLAGAFMFTSKTTASADSTTTSVYWKLDGGVLTLRSDQIDGTYAKREAGSTWSDKCSLIEQVVIANPIAPSSTSYWFSECKNLTTITNLNYLDTSNVTNMNSMFYNCNSLTSLDLSSFNTSLVTDMSSMFNGCSSLTSLDLSSFNTPLVTDMRNMFSGCTGLTELTLPASFYTSKVTDMRYMFSNCHKLTSLDLSSFNTSLVTNMNNMFYYCGELTSLDLSSFNTGKVTVTGDFLSGCFKLTTIKTPATIGTVALSLPSAINWWDGEKGANGEMITTGEITSNNAGHTIKKHAAHDWATEWTHDENSHWHACTICNEKVNEDVHSGTDDNDCTTAVICTCGYEITAAQTEHDFVDGECTVCGKVADLYWGLSNGTLTLSSYKTDDTPNNYAESVWHLYQPTRNRIISVTVDRYAYAPTSMDNWFWNCTNLVTANLSGLDTSRVTTMEQLFADCGKLSSVTFGELNTALVTKMNSLVRDCKLLTEIDLSSFDTSNVTDMNMMFSGCSGLTVLDLSNFDISNVEQMGDMFSGCSGLKELNISSFGNAEKLSGTTGMFSGCKSLTTIDLSCFDTSHAKYMINMFSGCTGLTSLDFLSSFDTSNVTEMFGMFDGCTGLTSLDFSKFSHFDTSKVDNMGYMFFGCTGLTSLDLSGFDTSKVTTMSAMFGDCSRLTSLTLTGWDTGELKNISDMFFGCSSLKELDLSYFDTTKVTNADYMFDDCSSLNKILTPANIGTEALPLPDRTSLWWNETRGEIISGTITNADAASTIHLHTHEWASDWTYDDETHWHACNNGCNEKNGEATHSGTDDDDCTTAVTCSCGYMITAAKSHNFYGSWQYDSEGHWHECVNEDCTQTDTKLNHSGTDDNDCTTAVTCTCGYEIKAAEAEHNYSETWTTDENQHWHVCQNTGCTQTDTKADHEYTETIATETYLKSAATCTAKAVYYKSCVCGKYGTETFEYGELVAHTPAEAVRENEVAATCAQAGSYDEVVKCSVCDEELSRTEKPLAINETAHNWGEWTLTKEATEAEEGEERRICSNDDTHFETRPIPIVVIPDNNGGLSAGAIAGIVVACILLALLAVYAACYFALYRRGILLKGKFFDAIYVPMNAIFGKKEQEEENS